MRINFWMTRNGDYLSHNAGLTAEQIADLRRLQPGDRLVIYTNDANERPDQPHVTLRKMQQNPADAN